MSSLKVIGLLLVLYAAAAFSVWNEHVRCQRDIKFQETLNSHCVDAMRNMEIKFSEDIQKYEKRIVDLEEYHAALSKANAQLVAERDFLKKNNTECWKQRSYFVNQMEHSQHPLKNPLDSNCLSPIYNPDGSIILDRPKGQAFADQCEDHSGD